MSLTDSQKDSLVLCSFLFSLLSLISSLTVIMYYIWFKELRKFAFKLVALTALSDAIRCVGNLIGSPADGPLCQTQGFLKTFGGVASFFWVGCMAFTIQLICISEVKNPNCLLLRYHYVTWTMACFSAFLPLALDCYTALSSWCWISADNEGSILRWSSFYGILFFFFIWICYVYISLWCHLKDLPDKSKVPRMVYRLWIYPLVLLICYGPASIRRVWNIVGSPPYSLAVAHVCCASLHGFVNAIAYGRNSDIRALNKHLLDRTLGDCYGFRNLPHDKPTTRWEKERAANNTQESDNSLCHVTNTATTNPTDQVPAGLKSGDFGYSNKLIANVQKPSKSNSRIEMTPTATPEPEDLEKKKSVDESELWRL